MDWEDVAPTPKATVIVGEDLRAHSLADLKERIERLEAEIDRVKAEINGKQAHEKAAADIFKR